MFALCDRIMWKAFDVNYNLDTKTHRDRKSPKREYIH